ncbi:hypothetical protein D3C79_529510 [compost metagenome]
MVSAAGGSVILARLSDRLPLPTAGQLVWHPGVCLAGWRTAPCGTYCCGADVMDATTSTWRSLHLLAGMAMVCGVNSGLRSAGGTVGQLLAIGIGGCLPGLLVRMGAVKRAFPLRLVLGSGALAAYSTRYHVVAGTDASRFVSWTDVDLYAGESVGGTRGITGDGPFDFDRGDLRCLTAIERRVMVAGRFDTALGVHAAVLFAARLGRSGRRLVAGQRGGLAAGYLLAFPLVVKLCGGIDRRGDMLRTVARKRTRISLAGRHAGRRPWSGGSDRKKRQGDTV